jgi:hypothetical protein
MIMIIYRVRGKGGLVKVKEERGRGRGIFSQKISDCSHLVKTLDLIGKK